QVPARAMQIQYGGCCGVGVLPIPGCYMVAVGKGEVEDVRTFGRLAPPTLAFFRREYGLALPFVQLAVAIAGHAGDADDAGGKKVARETEYALGQHGKSISSWVPPFHLTTVRKADTLEAYSDATAMTTQ